VFALVAIVGAVADILQRGLGQLVVGGLLAAGGYMLGRRAGRRPEQPRVHSACRDETQAELARLRADVAELEDAAARPLSAIVASYQHIAGRYRNGSSRR
jgi:hypothetical protein